jgi:tryptophanyl-tRNA synthetase
MILMALLSTSLLTRRLLVPASHGAARRRAISASVAEAPAAAASTEGEQKPAQKKRVLSGVQPTGSLHLGNYLGAIRQWVANQDEYDNYFCVVDLHAITAPHTPKELTKSTYQTAALYLAAGLDPAKSKIFVQSHVRQHAELAWLLNCATPMGWLERMIQYKEKAAKQEGEGASVGLFDYPVLMAADILLYQAALVPVGEDQRQHLELTRDIARRFNDKYGKKRRVFREPEALIVKSNARVMSLQDGTSKMSKSAENDNSRINLLDPPDVIRRKVKKCKTDAVMGVGYAPDRPEANNLLDMYGAVSGKSKEEVAAEAAEWVGWGTFKPILADALVAHLEPLQQRYNELLTDTEYLEKVLADGAEAAEAVAEGTCTSAKRAMGFTMPGDAPKV